MPSPFPGMNPYLEQRDLWRGFHGGLMFSLAAALTPQIVPRYFVECEESLYIDRSQLFAVADVAIADPTNSPPGGVTNVAVQAPVTSTVVTSKPVRKKRRWLSIRDTQNRNIVTVIEVLSPSEKRSGEDRNRYLRKRDRILRSNSSLVEIDLLRGGVRMPITPLPPSDYCVMVSRRGERPRVGLWPFGLRDPLPAIPIPLSAGEREPSIQLKSVVDRVYDEMGYAHRVYQGVPDPPLSADDAEWAKGFISPPL